MKQQQEEIWEAAVDKAQHLVDGLGMPMDKEIVETVAILRLMGMHTTMSCGGHLGRITGGPYVVFTSPKAAKYRAICQQIADPTNPEYKQAIKKATRINILERLPLWQLLDEFYKNRTVPNDQRIIMRTPAFSTRLECHGADQAHILGSKERKELLNRQRAEMQKFTDFLKQEYFKTVGLG